MLWGWPRRCQICWMVASSCLSTQPPRDSTTRGRKFTPTVWHASERAAIFFPSPQRGHIYPWEDAAPSTMQCWRVEMWLSCQVQQVGLSSSLYMQSGNSYQESTQELFQSSWLGCWKMCIPGRVMSEYHNASIKPPITSILNYPLFWITFWCNF